MEFESQISALQLLSSLILSGVAMQWGEGGKKSRRKTVL